MPPGTFMNLRSTKPTSEVKTQVARVTANGDKYFDIVMQDRFTGEVSISSVYAGVDSEAALNMDVDRSTIAKNEADALMSPLERQYKQAQINKANLETAASYKVEGPSANANTGNYLANYGPITAYGSYDKNGKPVWQWGLDVDLKKGDPVYSPVTGEVTKVGTNGGFGQQVQIKDSAGNSIWLSHLDGINAEVGQKVSAGALVGIGGNTGTVIKGPKGDGSHLDITIKKPDGSYMTAKEVEKYITGNYSKEVESGRSVTKTATSATDKKKEEIDFLKASIQEDKLLGPDGKMAPENYNIMKQSWTGSGYPAAEFDSIFGQYINRNQSSKYEIGNLADSIKKTEDNRKAAEKLKQEALDRVLMALPF